MKMIKYLAKFVTLREHAELLQHGKLFMRPASYYHRLELGQGDLREAAIFEDVCIYKHSRLPIYCLYTIYDSDIKDGLCEISGRCVKDFHCENGYVVLLDIDRFGQVFHSLQTDGYAFSARNVQYKIKTPELIYNLFCNSSVDNLFIKHPFFNYQQEFRLVVEKEVYPFGEPMIDHIEYSLSCEFGTDARIVEMASLKIRNDKFILNV